MLETKSDVCRSYMGKTIKWAFPPSPSRIELILKDFCHPTLYISSSFSVTEFLRRLFSQSYFLVALAYWHSLILFATVFRLLTSFVLSCEFHHELGSLAYSSWEWDMIFQGNYVGTFAAHSISWCCWTIQKGSKNL